MRDYPNTVASQNSANAGASTEVTISASWPAAASMNVRTWPWCMATVTRAVCDVTNRRMPQRERERQRVVHVGADVGVEDEGDGHAAIVRRRGAWRQGAGA